MKAPIPAILWPKMLFVLLTEQTGIISAGRVSICLRTADNEPSERSFPKQDEVLCPVLPHLNLLSDFRVRVHHFPTYLELHITHDSMPRFPSEG